MQIFSIKDNIFCFYYVFLCINPLGKRQTAHTIASLLITPL